MRDLAVHDHDLIVATHGRAFWILDDISPLRQFSPKLGSSEAALLEPAPALRVRRSTGTDTPIQPDEPAGQNPPDGAIIDYYLGKDASRPVNIEVLDGSGMVIAHVSSSDPPQYSPEQMQRELIPQYWIRKLVPPGANAGMHRWVWDLHYTAPRSEQRGYPISAVPGDTPQEPAGPVAAPGDYQVRLSIGAHRWHVLLKVLPDPRVKMSAQEYAAQFAAAHQLAEALDASTEALLSCKSMRAQLEHLRPDAKGPLSEQTRLLDTHIGELLESKEKVQPPRRGLERLNGDAAILYGQVNDVDAVPTAVQSEQTERITADWRELEPRWQHLRDVEVPQLNHALAKARLARIVPDTAPPRDLNFADED
jgi:hypothetical protein